MYKYHRFHLLQYSWFSMLLFFGILILSVSCDIEDDMPPPSAYEEPDPSEECEFKIVVPVLADGLDFECGVPQTESFGEKDGTITIESSDNPAKEGINTSEKVMKVEQSAGVEGWAGFFFNLAEKIDFSEKRTIKIKVYSPAAGEQVNLKLEDAVDGAISTEVIAETTVANEWEELSFSFSSRDSDKYQKMVLFFNFNGNKDAATVHYFDDIVLVEGGGAEEPEGPSSVPAVAAQAPTLDESLVISLFSDAYDNVTVDTWRTEWSDAVLTDTLIAGDAVKKYSQLNFVGIEAVSRPIAATSMTHFHVDVWTADATEIKSKLVDFGADGAFDGGDDVEHEIVIEN